MHVILAMATVAIGGDLQGRRLDGRVARLARQLLMRAGQWIFGLRCVIKAPTRPAVRVVARCTVRSEASLVLSVIVAFFTSDWRLLVC